MHYKNGREAKNGDKVIVLSDYSVSYIGILYDAQAGNDFCNGKVALICSTDPCPNLQEVLHLDDVKGLLPTKPSTSSGSLPTPGFALNLEAVPNIMDKAGG